jgi:hypothetical protein
MIERVLDAHLPRRAEPRYDGIHDPRMAGIGQAIELGALPAKDDLDGDAERRGNALQQAQSSVLSLPALERRHCLLGHTDERGEFRLGKAAAPPDQPQDPADALLIHGEMIEADDHLVLTNDSTACGAAAIRAGGRPPPVARRPPPAIRAARRPPPAPPRSG